MEIRSKGELNEGEGILQTEERHGLYLSKCRQCDQMQENCEGQNM